VLDSVISYQADVCVWLRCWYGHGVCYRVSHKKYANSA
jgi:hypothetical protein